MGRDLCARRHGSTTRLAAGDVRLTMGGEPTFVSIDNQVDPEWTTDADGPHKRERASVLAARLKAQWAPQGLVQRSQGKWYPGEPLPRWQIGLYWRADGVPLWSDESAAGRPVVDGAAGRPGRTRRRAPAAGAIAAGLGLPAEPGAARLRGRAQSAGRDRFASPQATPSPPATIWRPTPPTPAPHCWPGWRTR